MRTWEIATHHNASGHYGPIVNGPKTSGEELVLVVEKSEYDKLYKGLESLYVYVTHDNKDLLKRIEDILIYIDDGRPD